MAISFVSGIFRNNSRIRLFFDADLAGLAFQSFWFTVETSGNESPPVTVLAAVAVIGHPGAIELALNQELIPDVTYQVHIQAGLPGFTDMAPELNLELRTPGAKPSKRNTGSLLPDLYGEDITWRTDWIEDADGDLAITTGLDNLEGALNRGLLSEGIMWDPAYGLKGRRYVDAPALGLGPMQNDAVRHVLRDDRVAEATGASTTDRIQITCRPIGEKRNVEVSVAR